MTGPPARDWALDADGIALSSIGEVTDLVVVFDRRGTIVWASPFTLHLLGYDDEPDLSVEGHNITEFVHPEDMLRAAEVMGMLVDETIPVPVTPALYRLLRVDGTWVPVELNGAVLAHDDSVGEDDERLVILGRYSGDRDVQDRILERLTSGTRPTEAIDLVPQFGLWRHPHELYAVWYADDDGHRVMTGSHRAVELAALAAGRPSPWSTAAADGTEVIAAQDALPDALRIAAEAMGFGTCWAIPVPDPLHLEPAVVLVWSVADDRHALAHRFALETMATSLTLILQWRAQLAALEEAARRDPLTGTANRARLFHLLDQLAEDDADGACVGFLYVDLDLFKEVNDVYGHSAGDAVLCEVVRRITGVLRPGDVLARLGGDEFAVVCPGLRDDDRADAGLTSIAERIIDAVSLPMRIGTNEVAVGASVGIAVEVVATLVPDALIDRADQALYHAKTSGRGCWHLSETGATGATGTTGLAG